MQKRLWGITFQANPSVPVVPEVSFNIFPVPGGVYMTLALIVVDAAFLDMTSIFNLVMSYSFTFVVMLTAADIAQPCYNRSFGEWLDAWRALPGLGCIWGLVFSLAF